MVKVITKSEFEKLKPYDRGYITYWCGENPDQPHVPNEKNPYKAGSFDASEWDRGQRAACQNAQDLEE